MNYPAEHRVEVYALAVRGLLDLEPDPEKRLKYLDFIDIYADLDEGERSRYRREYPQEADAMTSFAERFRHEGIQQGMQQGEARVLLRLMQSKFGQVPEQARQRVETADANVLLEWSERLLAASKLDDVFH